MMSCMVWLNALMIMLAVSFASFAQDEDETQATIVIDASQFLDEIPKGHTITDAARLDVPWVFNNTALEMSTRSNYVIKLQIPEPGTYYLFARSHGKEQSSFRVAVNDQVIQADLGNAPLNFRKAGAFQLKAGKADIRLMRIESSPVLDVLVLTQNADFTEEDLKSYELHEEVELVKEYAIPKSGAVKFGDVDGDGKTDFMVLESDFSAHVFNYDGEKLWSYQAPEEEDRERSSFEAPGLVWDLDEDSHAEAIHWRFIEDEEYLVVADGHTGEIKNKTLWPTRPLPHDYNNFRLAIGKLKPGYPNQILVLTDMGGTISIAAYDKALQQLWEHKEEKKKDHLGHYIYPVDLDHDDIDEVVVGSLVLDAAGHEIWNRFDLFYDHHDHVDSYRFADLNQDGQLDLVTAHSEVGVVAIEAMTGEIMWQNMAEHTQQLETGDFLDDVPAPQVAVGARIYGNRSAGEPYLWAQVHWFDPEGNLLKKWPGNPLNGNPVFVKGDWRGDGTEELFWYKFRMTGTGKGELYFGEPVFHMFDFMRNGAEEVITLHNGILKVYGCRSANHDEANVISDPDYLRRKVTNHTHY